MNKKNIMEQNVITWPLVQLANMEFGKQFHKDPSFYGYVASEVKKVGNRRFVILAKDFDTIDMCRKYATYSIVSRRLFHIVIAIVFLCALFLIYAIFKMPEKVLNGIEFIRANYVASGACLAALSAICAAKIFFITKQKKEIDKKDYNVLLFDCETRTFREL